MEERTARQYTLVAPEDCDPPHRLDLHPGSRDSIKVAWLEAAFRTAGFDPAYPALVGYPLGGRIQLLSGTHRHEAALRVGMKLPVKMHLRSDVEAAWGTEDWAALIADIPVRDLENATVQPPSPPPGLDERVSPAEWRRE